MRHGKHLRHLGWLLALSWLAAEPTTALGQEWTQWRGSQRDGKAAAELLPSALPSELERRWRIEVGRGYSSPVVTGDRIFLLTREADEEVVRSLDLSSGATIWRQAYAAPYEVNVSATRHGDGPKSTPVLSGGKLYVFGIDGILSCFDAESGDLVWRREFAGEYPTTSPIYGASASPLVDGGSVFIHVGGYHDGGIAAFDVDTGEPIWTTRGDGPGHSSPILLQLHGQRQLITQTDAHIVGVTPESGRILWKIPFTTDYDQSIVTPVVDGEHLIFSGLDKGVFAVEILRDGDSWTSVELWRNDDLPMYMSSPVLVGTRLFGFTHKRSGQFFAVDVASGQTLWTSLGREGDNAALVGIGDRLLALTDGGELIVLAADATEFRPLARYEVAQSGTYAHPVPTRQGVLIKDASSLSLWQIPDAGAEDGQ